MTVVNPPAAWAYVHSDGREWVVQEKVADYFRRQPCTIEVESEFALRRWGPPGPWARNSGMTGNMRPDVVVWCQHRRPKLRYMTVVEVKAGTAGRSAVAQLVYYLNYLWEQPDSGFEIRGILAAPSLANSVRILPPEITFWRTPLEWRR